VSLRSVYRYVLASLLLTALATLLRFLGGYLVGNAAVAVEAMHALLDVVITLAVLASMVLVRSEVSRKFPYGLYRIEDLASLGLAVAMAFLGAEVLTSSLTTKSLTPPNPLPAITQAASLPLIGGAAYVKFRGASVSNSPALRADALHTVSDVIEGSGVLVGLITYLLTNSVIAYLASVIVAVAGLFWASYEAGKDSLLSLLDLPKDRGFMEGVKEVFREVSRGEYVLTDLRARWAGPVVFLEVTTQAPPLHLIEDTYVFISRFSREVRRRYPYVEDVVVKVEPRVREEFTICVPQDEVGMGKPLSKHFGRAKYFTIVRVRGGEVVKVEYVRRPEPKVGTSEGGVRRKLLVGATVAEELHRLGVTDVLVTNIGELAYSLLLRHKIFVWRVDEGTTLEVAIRKFLNRELTRLTEPTREEPWVRPHSSR